MTTRFIFPGQYAMRPMKKGKGKVLAYFDVVDTVTGLIYRDCKLIDGPNGTFVSSPSRDYEKDGETKYSNYWGAAYDPGSKTFDEKGLAWQEELAEAAYAAYQEKTNGGDAEKPSARRQSSGRQQTARSARGPVNPPRVPMSAGDDEIPF